MSKRLNKRQQRLQQLEEPVPEVTSVGPSEDNQEEPIGHGDDQEEKSQPVNAFAALNIGDDDAPEDEEEDNEVEEVIKKKKTNKKKKKKKNASSMAQGDEAEEITTSGLASTAPMSHSKKSTKPSQTDYSGMDEVDRALAEIKAQYGEPSTTGPSDPSSSSQTNQTTASSLALRTLLTIDPKNLDPDLELRKFFGSKVIAAPSGSTPTRGGPGGGARRNLIKTHLSKPRPNWPPPTSLLGLGMRELTDDEVQEKRARLGLSPKGGKGEKWFTFEHGGMWKEAQRQFLGAIGSHDPNQLFALLQVYPYHTDTILQMGEVYRQQADLGQASEFIDRALFAFERAFMPGFGVAHGNVRLDFDRVENRGFYLGVVRNLQFLGRRGCWNTSFNFAKFLLSLDPHTDPQGALLHLDFLALKSNNQTWLLEILAAWSEALDDLEGGQTKRRRVELDMLPGMAWAKALGLRMEETKKGSKIEKGKADVALREAVLTFPEVLPLLADKVGFNVPSEIRSHPSVEIRLGYEPGPLTPLHLLSQIYVSRSHSLFKEASHLSWIQAQLPQIYPDLLSSSPSSPSPSRARVLSYWKSGSGESLTRHVLVSEDNSSWLGFLEAGVKEGMGMSFDPAPPRTAITAYNNAYFSQMTTRRRPHQRRMSNDEGEDEGEDDGFMQAMINSILQFTAGAGGEGENAGGGAHGMDDQGVLANLGGRLRRLLGQAGDGEGGGEMSEEERDLMMAQIMALAEENRAVPGGFPGEGNIED
ncbi:Uncharacterized conserved protein [Phaffia rhodozyma]|uniref:Uncharacterized conserved protein n=1 Tax=Phaffia rhodozyma TaxID=264483 RepID=A0A0F7SJI9_PHARH|nr:Uncharacterized conserved protein [Phaffia rhodozyma]